MKLSIRTDLLLNPVVLVLGPVVASFLAWSLPPSSWVFHGWVVRTDVTPDALLALCAFYLLLATAVTVGSRGEFHFQTQEIRAERLEIWLKVLAAVGVAAYAFLLFRRVDVVAAIRELSANRLDAALPDEAGPQSLRYLVVPFGALSIVQLLSRRFKISYVGGVAALLFVGLAAGRLLFLLAAFTAATAFSAEHNRQSSAARIQIPVKRTLGMAIAMFGVLVLLTYPRVANTYAVRGVTNPAAVTTSSLISYLSTPAQVQLAIGDSVGKAAFSDVQPRIGPSSDLVLPTFLRSEGRDGKQHMSSIRYGRDIDFRTNFTTNSVFADVLVERGPAGLMIVVVLAGLSAWAARLSLAIWPGQAGGLFAGPLLYPLTEIWRANVFLLGSQVAVLLAFGLAFALSGRRREVETLIDSPALSHG